MVHSANRGAAFASPYVWAALLLSVLTLGIVLGFVVMRRQRPQQQRQAWIQSYNFQPLAMLEAFVAIFSGVLLWMGFWDFIDVYMVPRQWWAKLCMVLVGALGLFLTRTLYDEQEVEEPPADEPKADEPRSPRSPRSASLEMPSVACPKRERSTSSSSSMPPVLGSPVSQLRAESRSPLASRLRALAGQGDESYRQVSSNQPVPSAEDDGDADEERPKAAGASEPAAGPRERRYFDAPQFSCSRCTRALFSILSGLTLWVGIWDLIDEHLLPGIFASCVREPDVGCAEVKLSLIGVGALGMYVTRSLYGATQGQGAQFQRIE